RSLVGTRSPMQLTSSASRAGSGSLSRLLSRGLRPDIRLGLRCLSPARHSKVNDEREEHCAQYVYENRGCVHCCTSLTFIVSPISHSGGGCCRTVAAEGSPLLGKGGVDATSKKMPRSYL